MATIHTEVGGREGKGLDKGGKDEYKELHKRENEVLVGERMKGRGVRWKTKIGEEGLPTEMKEKKKKKRRASEGEK